MFYENKPYSRDLKTPRLDETGTNVVYENLSKKDFPELKSAIFEKTRYNLFDYFFEHVKDKSTRRHIFISGASGSGKSTYLYGIWKECLTINYYIPIYVPLYNVESSIKKYIVDQYLSHVSIKNFNWIKGDGFKKTPYHIILLLDGFNELSENSPKTSKKLIKEINSFLTTEKITVLITSRNPVLMLDNEITRLKMCQLTNDQIKRFLGGNDEFLEASWYRGLLDNPFMLEICIKTFSDKKTGINSLSQTSMGMIFKEYFDKQTGREGQNEQIKSIELSVVYRLIVDIILPLVAMKLDKKDDDIEICKDDKQIKWAVFRDAVNSVSDRLEEYSDSIEFCINENEGYQEHLDKIYNLQNKKALAAFILDAGRKLEVFSDKSKRGKTVIWDHEIYRDYFVARGYALFSAAHENSEIMVANLGRQINYRYPEPGFKNTKVTPTIRQYHVRKAQMYVDLIDAMLTDESEFDDENIEELKETAVYRRLVRDIALIYEDLKDNKMMKAADLGLKYYKSDLEMYNILSEYDINYREVERRYADAAYSISSLAYNYTHDRFRIKRKGEDLEYDKEYDKESRLYLKKACIALNAADSIFNGLSDEMKRNSTVRDDILKCQGNLAAYNIGMYKITGDKKYLDAAKEIHENNERERRKNMRLMDKEGGDLVQIKNDIASSYNGIATCFYYMKEYKTAIEYQRKAAAIRPRNNYDGKCMAYRNIIGCYAKLNDYNSYEAEQIVKRIRSSLNLIIRESIYAGYDQLKTNIEIIINKLSDDQKIEYEKDILAINNKLIRISRNSLN